MSEEPSKEHYSETMLNFLLLTLILTAMVFKQPFYFDR
jgi:hypothetical protein